MVLLYNRLQVDETEGVRLSLPSMDRNTQTFDLPTLPSCYHTSAKLPSKQLIIPHTWQDTIATVFIDKVIVIL